MTDRDLFFQNIKDDKLLRDVLQGIDFRQITDDEFAILLVWTAPLVTSKMT